MDLTSISSLAFLAPVILFYNQIKGFLSYCVSFLIRSEKISNIDNYQFLRFCFQNCRAMNFGNVEYNQQWPFFKNLDCFGICAFICRKRYIFLHKCIPIIITPNDNGCSVFYLNLFSFNKFLEKFYLERTKEMQESTIERRNKRHESGFYVHEVRGTSLKKIKTVENQSSGSTLSAPFPNSQSQSYVLGVHYSFLDVTPPILSEEFSANKPHDNKSKYFFTKEGMHVLKNVESWLDSKRWYEERNINWRRSCLLHGKPGTGKSALITEIAKKLNLTVYIFDLSTLDDQEFSDALKNMVSGSLLVFEDLDCIWDGRENKSKTEQFGGLSFECFINKLSGVDSIKNCFVFITTNHIDKLDSALLRPGRVDEIIELGPLTKDGKLFIAQKMLDQWPELVEDLVKDDTIVTAAEFENTCTQLAIDRYWKDIK